MPVMAAKIFLIFVISLIVVFAQKYVTKYDNVDLDQILRNDRLLNTYVNCLLDKGRCTGDGQELKKVIPDALQTACQKCNERQRNGSRKVLNYLINERRDLYNKLEAKYDPQHMYRRRYEQYIRR